MIVRIGDFTLARGRAYRESPIGLAVAGSRMVQASPALRAKAKRHFDRGNHQTQCSFGVSRRHVSLEDAQEFTLLHAAQMQDRSGLVIFITESIPVRAMAMEGLIQSVTFSHGGLHRGISTFAQYTIIGGIFVQHALGSDDDAHTHFLAAEDGQWLQTESGETISIE